MLFTGRLDHRYAPGAVAAMDVLVVPSILDEAFGMVAAEGAAAGALPMVSRHSGLAEVAEALEGDVGRPGVFSFEPGPGAETRLAAGIDRLLSLPAPERGELRGAVSAFVAGAWSWDRTTALLLAAAGRTPEPHASTGLQDQAWRGSPSGQSVGSGALLREVGRGRSFGDPPARRR